MATTARSTTVTFAIVGSSDTTDDIQVELDEVANNNKSTFLPTETCHFLVFTNPTSLGITLDTTMGTITANGTKNADVEDTLQFVQSNAENLSKLPVGGVTTTWLGRAGGSPSVNGSTVSVPTIINGVLNCKYQATARAYKLSGVTIPAGMEEVEVLIVVSPS